MLLVPEINFNKFEKVFYEKVRDAFIILFIKKIRERMERFLRRSVSDSNYSFDEFLRHENVKRN